MGIVLAALLSSGGCGSGARRIALPADPGPAQQASVPRPDQIYLSGGSQETTSDYFIARVSRDSPWFDIFWRLADRVAKADAGAEGVTWGMAMFGLPEEDDPLSVVQRRQRVGAVIAGGSLAGSRPSLPRKMSFSLGLVYDRQSPLHLASDPYKKLWAAWPRLMADYGYPNSRSPSGSTWWVRDISISDSGDTYHLVVEGSRPLSRNLRQEHGAGYLFSPQEREIDLSKYDPSADLRHYGVWFTRAVVIRRSPGTG
jgi:hypothetical protein